MDHEAHGVGWVLPRVPRVAPRFKVGDVFMEVPAVVADRGVDPEGLLLKGWVAHVFVQVLDDFNNPGPP